MKFVVSIDATPEEARAFLGLPDLGPLQKSWIDGLQEFAAKGPGEKDWEKLVRHWAGVPAGFTAAGLSEAGAAAFENWRRLMMAAAAGGTGSADDPHKKS